MDTLQKAINDMSNTFDKKMQQFESELRKGSASSFNTSNMVSEFSAFKIFIMEALRSFQSQLDLLMQSVDHLEMRSRRKFLLIHGISEDKKENTAELVKNVICKKLKLTDFALNDIISCHRLGRSVSNRARPILFKLKDLSTKNNIWMAKTNLKGTGVTLSEFLTKVRYEIFMSARQRCGLTNCWTRDGIVFVLGSDGTRHRITRLGDLDGINCHQEKAVTVAKEPSKKKPTKK